MAPSGSPSAEGLETADRWLERLPLPQRPPAPQPTDAGSAISSVASRHGEAGLGLERRFRERDGLGDEPFYEAKNATLELSLDVALTWSRGLYRIELALLHDRVAALQPKRILDAGCEQGLVTCFIASTLPDAQVVGIDRSAAAITRGGELAALTGTDNASFNRCDLSTESPAGEPYDLILTSRSILGQAVRLPADEPAELLTGSVPADPDWRAQAMAVAGRLAVVADDHCRLITLERGGMTAIFRWFKVLAGVGFRFDRDQSATIATDEPGAAGQLLRMVEAVRESPGGGTGPDSLSAAWLLTALSPPVKLEDGVVLSGPAAESTALSAPLRVPVICCEWQGTGDSTGELERAELWELEGGSLLELRARTGDAREVRIHGPGARDQAIARLRRELDGIHGSTPVLAVPPLLGAAGEGPKAIG